MVHFYIYLTESACCDYKIFDKLINVDINFMINGFISFSFYYLYEFFV